jgi:hypothetical protein
MKSNVATDRNNAIFADERLCRDDLAGDFNGTIVPEQIWCALFLKRVWPVKAEAAIQQYAGCPERTARAYKAGDRIPSATVLRDLIRGDEGDRVLTELMPDKPPAWFCRWQRALKLMEAIDGVK